MGGYGRLLGGVGVSLDRSGDGREKDRRAAGRESERKRQIGRDHPWFVGRGS